MILTMGLLAVAPFVDVSLRQVWVLREDLIGRHAVYDHRDHCGDGHAQALDL